MRISLGALLLAHGLIKVFVFTPAGTVGFFESIGFPGILTYPVMTSEVALGLALMVGFQTRFAAIAALPILLGSIIPHAGNGFLFSSPNGGWEFPVLWSVLLVAQALMGSGAIAFSRESDTSQAA
jgi:putative oxidoreductase